jgi:threonine/homoserine/homoserine lactone efflux protein
MHLSNWLIFCGVALLVTFTPGPAVLLAVSNSVAVGLRLTIASSLGNALGLFIVSGIAMAGMGVVLAASATGFMVLKFVGALYLIYLGIKQWRSDPGAVPIAGTSRGPGASRDVRRLFRQGLLVALTNPKAILFFSALFPQFVTPDASALGQFAVLTTTFVAFALLSHAFYVVLIRVLKGRLANPQRTRLFNRASGGVFVVLGLSLLGVRNKLA